MSNYTPRLLLLLGSVFLASACMTSVPERESTVTQKPLVSSIVLSRTVGTVGEVFVSELQLLKRRHGELEIEVRSLPTGLRFDQSKMAILGVPKADGFFSVTIAVRTKRGRGIHFDTPEGAWMSERLDIDIYRPLEDETMDVAVNDYTDY
jgi:hypothetical protein